jgi:hypothetical protein
MRIIGLLSWYDEDVVWLRELVTSLPLIGCRHLAALDGSYALLGARRHLSPTEQPVALLEAGEAAQTAVTVGAGPRPWDSEMEKRTTLFRLAEEAYEPEPGDWYFVIDADEVVRSRCNVAARLSETTAYAAKVTLWWSKGSGRGLQRSRRFFRAEPGLAVEGNHYTYVLPDGRRVWGNELEGPLLPSIQTAVNLEHRTVDRADRRKAKQLAYYRERDRLLVERVPCLRCGATAAHVLPTDVRVVQGGLEGGWGHFCEGCSVGVREENVELARRHGLDPAQLLLDPTR